MIRNNVIHGVILAFCACIMHAATAMSDSPREQMFASGLGAYESGDYDAALNDFDSLYENGAISGNLFYNIANCHLRLGHTGYAILNYERAALFIPSDGALRTNLSLAKRRMKQQDSAAAMPPCFVPAEAFLAGLTLPTATLVLTAVFFLLAVVSAIPKGKGVRRFIKALPGLILLLLAVWIAVPYAAKWRWVKTGTIVIRQGDARYGPGNDFDVKFPVYEGMRLNVIKSFHGWLKVRRPNGEIGWVAENAAARVSNFRQP